MHGFIPAFVVLLEIVNLRVAIVTGGDAIIRIRLLDLFKFQAAIVAPRLGQARLQKAAASPAAEIVGAVGGHVDKIFFADDGSNDETQILGNGVAQGLSDQLAGILYREFDLQILVPVRADLELALTDPLGVVFDNAFDLEVVFDVELVQPDPD